MGKEAKIGLGVLGLLLVILAGVVVVRLVRPGNKPSTPLGGAEPAAGRESASSDRANSTGASQSQPTVVLADSRGSPAKQAPRELEHWKLTSDAAAKNTLAPLGLTAPPSNMPQPALAASPALASSSAGSLGLRPGQRVYVVVQGDTLTQIAKHELGNLGRWGEIAELNREQLGDDYNFLVPGTELILPGTATSAGTLTHRPEPGSRR